MGYNTTRTDDEDLNIAEAVTRYASDKFPEDYPIDRCVVCRERCDGAGYRRNRHLCRKHAAYVQAHLPHLQPLIRQSPTDTDLLVRVVDEYVTGDREPREDGLCLYPTCSSRGLFSRTLCRHHANVFKGATPGFKMKNRKRAEPVEATSFEELTGGLFQG